jgi:glycosyltransferase involved in cell wall biosynthesis
MNNIRLHIPAIPYTITRDEYSHDAFTGKVKRFSPMMRSRGFEVYHYGVETSESGANKEIQLMTKEEWTHLRIKTLQWLDPKLTLEQAIQKNKDPTLIPNIFSNKDSPLIKEFNNRLIIKLKEHYRTFTRDILCIPLSSTYDIIYKSMFFTKIETGIGNLYSSLDYRIFESQSWLSYTMGYERKNPNNYTFVIPNYYNINDFKLSLTPNPLRVGFLGRLVKEKGSEIICEIAKFFPSIEFIVCGSGDPSIFTRQPNIKYKAPIYGNECSEYLGDCVAVLCPSTYLEPFCGVSVEAQLCGTPVICSDYGGLTETVEQFKTGLRCHTLADYCYGIQLALEGAFDRKYIRERAVNLYDMYKLAYNYEYVFKNILDMYNGNGGWYSSKSHILNLDNINKIKNMPVIDIKERNLNTALSYNFFPFNSDSDTLFKINGERCSGTNFIHNLIEKNFKYVYSNHFDNTNTICYNWKHGIPTNEFKNIKPRVIDIIVFRKLDKWLVSMFKNSHSLKPYNTFEEFITCKQEPDNNYYDMNYIDYKTKKQVNIDDTDKTIFEIRYYKYKKLMEYFNNNNNVILVNLDYIQNDNKCILFLSELNRIFKLNNKSLALEKKHAKNKGENINTDYNLDINKYNNIIDQYKDSEIENEIDNLMFVIKIDDHTIYK